LCLVAYILDENLNHVRTIKIWREKLLSCTRLPFDTGSTAVFAAYAAQAELTIFKVLNLPFPEHVFDLHTAYLASSNILLPYEPDERRVKQRKRLPDACRAYGIEGWENLDKEQMAKDIGEGRWRDYGKDATELYCEEDVARSADLLRAMLRGSNRFRRINYPPRTFFRSKYASKEFRTFSKGRPPPRIFGTPPSRLVHLTRCRVRI
jgi:hypothetical protein